MKKKLFSIIAGFFLLCVSPGLMAQGEVTGKLIDKDTKDPLIGASIIVKGTTNGTVTGMDGTFNFVVPEGSTTLQFSYIGYLDKTKDVMIRNGEVKALGEINMENDAIGLVEVQVVASIARDRETPVAISNIKPQLISEKLGTQEFPEILKSTPSVYATKSGGGFGDSRINLRGFSSENIGVLINGVPINGMENGKVYWSNWAGLSDVTKTMQVQRGLGASKLAISSVGGTINILTKTTDAKAGGNVFYGMANDGYEKKGITASTGLLDNGWAVTMSLAQTSGDGYVKATEFNSYSYFLNISKRLNEKHILSFTTFGAPQWHNQRYGMARIEDVRNHRDGTRLNYDYGYKGGEKYNSAQNEYHKPQMSVNHFWDINEKSFLSTSVYASMAVGSGRRIRGIDKKDRWLRYDSGTGRPYEETKLTPEGLLDWDAVIAENAASENGSQAIVSKSVNSHDWYGILSTYNHQIGNISITAGVDGRYYYGYHREEIVDLLGGNYYLDIVKNTDDHDPKDGMYPEYVSNNINRAAGTPLQVGDVVGFNNDGEIVWGGLFGQAEYVTDQYSAFLSGSVSNSSYRRIDKFKYKPDEQKSDWKSYVSYSVKGGFNYNLNDQHNVFINGGYFTRAPYHKYVFLNYTNEINDKIQQEKVLSGEVGYGWRTNKLKLDVSYYHTYWLNKSVSKSTGDDGFAISNGVDALHYGVEAVLNYRPVKGMTLRAMASVGNWTWLDDAVFDYYDINQNYIESKDVYIKDAKVGDAAQSTASLGVDYWVLPKLKIGADYNFYDDLYAYYDPTYNTSINDRGKDTWQLPAYGLLDVNMKYDFDIAGLKASLYGKVNNVLNTEYIADAKDGSNKDAESALVYYGFGRTMSVSLKVRF
ncbi:MAG: TonB-dependent receptor [Marinilabiliaceae bacterium]|nr:TonB-dependent receptor [Marinilabiliaceae bacterium]